MFTPIAFLTAALAPLIVGIAYGRGAFGAASAELTSVVVLGLAPTIVISMASPVLTGSLNARRKGTLLLAGGVLNVTLNLVFNVVLGATMGLIGIALSSSAATALVLVFFARRLSRMEDGLRLRPLVRQVVRTSLAAIPGIVPLGLLVWALPPGTPLVQSIILAGMVTVAGLASYLVMSAVLQVREPLEILAVVRSVAVRFITSRRPA